MSVAGEQDVTGRYVPVNDGPGLLRAVDEVMGGRERCTALHADPAHHVGRKAPAGRVLEQLLQRSVHPRKCHVRAAFVRAEVVHGAEIGVAQASAEARLAIEPLTRPWIRELILAHDLEDHALAKAELSKLAAADARHRSPGAIS